MAADLANTPVTGSHVQACGDAPIISGYLGTVETFDHAIATFATRYADQVERDYEQFARAIQSRQLEVHIEDET